MFAYVARQPILDNNMEVQAYELLFRDGKNNCFPDVLPDEATSSILARNYLTLGLEEFSGDKRSFINFHKDSLLNDFTSILNPEKTVVEIVETIPTTREMVEACKRIKNNGYTLALDDHNFDPRWDVFLPYIDMLKVDTHRTPIETIAQHLPKFQRANIKLVAEKVETREEYEKLKPYGFDLYQGYYFAKPQIIKSRNLPTSKLAMLQLMEITAHAFDLQKVNDIFEKDVGLSYMLLRFINNP
ncbi:EAL and HDOD domain-containing protein [Pseudobowmanella zhangzhouensis]|uniref:EAL and HDOD domain-containing protein n=1 Tax=Pseudobowmanella zhangzhouensis TaxID=1537679 RepID=UPI00360FEF1F